MSIFFTGASGKAGRHVATHLAEQGHQVTNADLVPLGHPAVADLRIDLTDIGETYSALAGLARMEELEVAQKPAYDAVVHFAAVPAILLASDARTYATNVLSTYNVLEAATRLGVRKIVFASSETTYGICFAQGERRPQYVPVDEDHPTIPEDSYAMSKVANEVTARSFQARTGADVYGLRPLLARRPAGSRGRDLTDAHRTARGLTRTRRGDAHSSLEKYIATHAGNQGRPGSGWSAANFSAAFASMRPWSRSQSTDRRWARKSRVACHGEISSGRCS